MTDQFYYISAENTRVGPIPWAVLEQLHHAGSVSDETLTAPEGASGWTPFQDLKVKRVSQASLPPVPQSQLQGAAFSRPGIVDEGAKWLNEGMRWLKKLNLKKLFVMVHKDINLVGVAFGITCVIMLVGYTGVSLVQGRNPLAMVDDSDQTEEVQQEERVVSRRRSADDALEYEILKWVRKNVDPQSGRIVVPSAPSRSGASTFNQTPSALELQQRARTTESLAGQSHNFFRQTPQYQGQPPQNRPAASSTYQHKASAPMPTSRSYYNSNTGEIRQFRNGAFVPSPWTPAN